MSDRGCLLQDALCHCGHCYLPEERLYDDQEFRGSTIKKLHNDGILDSVLCGWLCLGGTVYGMASVERSRQHFDCSYMLRSCFSSS